MKKITLIGFILCIILLSGCDQFMDEVITYSGYKTIENSEDEHTSDQQDSWDPIDQDRTTRYGDYGKESYYPLVEGMKWRYLIDDESGGFTNNSYWDDSAEVKISEITQISTQPSCWTVYIDDLRGDSLDWTFDIEDGRVTGGNGNGFACIFPAFSFDRIMEQVPMLDFDGEYEQKLNTTETYSSSSSYGGSSGNCDETYDITVTYSSLVDEFQTPGGLVFHDCVQVDFQVSFTSPPCFESYQDHVTVVLSKGVGYVYVQIEYNTGEVDTVYVTDYTPFGETVRFFDDDGSTQLMDGKVYVEGDILTMPQVYKTGYDLTGWSDGTDVHTPGDTFVMPDDDVDFTAVWTVAEQ
jgi:hypothetical protein